MMIRFARPDDDRAVGELLVTAFVESYAKKLPDVVVTDARKETLRDVAGKRAHARVFVADKDGRVVGTVALWLPGTSGSEAWLPNAADLRHLAVDANHRGGEVSCALLDAAETEARQSGADTACLHVRRGAHGVRRLYEARSYVRDVSGDIDRLPEVFLEGFVKRLG